MKIDDSGYHSLVTADSSDQKALFRTIREFYLKIHMPPAHHKNHHASADHFQLLNNLEVLTNQQILAQIEIKVLQYKENFSQLVHLTQTDTHLQKRYLEAVKHHEAKKKLRKAEEAKRKEKELSEKKR
jgi:hypothetical protein